ncbi:YciI family protein [Cohnella rhizosphaerae]|uniref:YciI family protein n=1 Tax=Cohnella rhizosphaerae TaxID=1457232 RepID=A0A9X4KZ73_9BACL|nr:YciI family protein [Cohnella rhizosphaerae]MDG0814086.1 YciI family protein [Cohnella rhizosphaerae]
MRFMILIRANARFEAGIGPAGERAAAFAAYLREMKAAGVLIESASLLPSADGLRLTYSQAEGPPAMTAGPFCDAEGQVAGYMLLEADSEREAYAWAAGMPDPYGFGEGGIELRRLRDTAVPPFAASLNPIEADLRDQIGALRNSHE